MAAVEQQLSPNKAFHVAVRKEGLDPTVAWWRRAYHRFVWKPFLKFSFHVFGIPAPERMNADGSFTFLEGIGIATDRATADAMCEKSCWYARYRVSPLPLNTPLPIESVDAYPQSWPKSDYRPPAFPKVSVSLYDLNRLRRTFEHISEKATNHK